jgi:hypothetical protein
MSIPMMKELWVGFLKMTIKNVLHASCTTLNEDQLVQVLCRI